LILSIDIQQYYHYQSLYIDTSDLNIHSSPLPAFYIYKISYSDLEINGNIDFKVGRDGARPSAPSHMGQSTLSSVSSMSMDTTSLNTPVFGSAPASDHGE
jgi:hypothetical protein